MNEDVCTACGERNPAGSAFCLYCGVYLGWDEAAAQERPTVRQPAVERSAGDPLTVEQTAVLPETQTQVQAPPTRPTPYEDDSGRPKPGELACPQCGLPNAATLRFCRKCGKALHPSTSTGQAPPAVVRQGWWQRFWDPKDRRARGAYRRSLPPLYRWRRVIVALGAIVAALVLLSVVGTNPVTWAKDRLNDVRGSLVPIDPVTFAAVPPDSVAPDSGVAALGTAPLDDAWATAWSPLVPLDGCPGKAAAKGAVSLTFKDPVRVRRLDVRAGLPADNANRTLQFRPSVLLVVFDGHCSELPLKDVSDLQQLKLDTEVPVKQLLIAIGATYPARPDAAQNLTTLTSLAVQSRPH
jgi:hypothetical protein